MFLTGFKSSRKRLVWSKENILVCSFELPRSSVLILSSYFMWLLALEACARLAGMSSCFTGEVSAGTWRNSTKTLMHNRKSSMVNYRASCGLKLPWRSSSGSMWYVWPMWGWEHRVCGVSMKEKGKSTCIALLDSVLLGVSWDSFLLVPEMWGREEWGR